jgi:hypothetical protein
MAVLVAALLCLGLAACGQHARQVAPACTGDPAVVERALARAPAAVTLPGGIPVSACVADADTDAELQNTGRVLTAAAEHLAGRAEAGDAASALRLGYLAGAVRRGAARTNGVGAQLQRRIEVAGAGVAGGGDHTAQRALERGLAAGAASG